MSNDPPLLSPAQRQQAGHYEILGETFAAFELFENGWNPYSRFLDVDKVDFILRKLNAKIPVYREAQVKFGKLHPVGSKWEKALFDVTTWRFFRTEEFEAYRHRKDFYLIYVMSAGLGEDREIFIFPIAAFCELIEKSISRKSQKHGTKKVMYLSRSLVDRDRWYLRTLSGKMDSISKANCFEVSKYRRAFHLLD